MNADNPSVPGAAASRPWWKVVLLLLGGFLLFMLLYGLLQSAFFLTDGRTALNLAAGFICGAAILAVYSLTVRLFERHRPADMPARRFLPDICGGFLLSIVYFAAVTAIIALLGCYAVDSVSFNASVFFPKLAFFFLVACGEEVIFRGVFFRIIDEKWGAAAALAVSALLFGLFHIFNPGATLWSSVAIAIEAGLLLGAAYKFSGNLWLPIGIHWGWNLMEGPVLGFAVSGNGMAPGEAVCLSTVSGPDIISGGAFGLEASIFAAVIGLAIAAWFVHRTARR